jgi:hypothetical protein
MTYEEDRRRADMVSRDVQLVLRTECGWVTMAASEQLDQHRATDLVTSLGLHIAVRCRSYQGYFEKYGTEFTIRSRRETGAKTELAKIMEGFGDFMHYGFVAGFNHKYFRIIDLDKLRAALGATDLDDVSVELPNRDGETYFRAFDLNRFPKDASVVFKEGTPLDCSLTLEQVQGELRSGFGALSRRQQLWRRLDFLVAEKR